MKPIITLLDDGPVRGGRLWIYILLAHAAVAGGWWWLMPGGFPWFHTRFWINGVLPRLVIVVCITSFFGILTRRDVFIRPAIYAILGLWTAAVPMAWLTFPISIGRFGIPVGMMLALVWLAWYVRSPKGNSKRPAIVGFLPFLFFGATVPLSQRAPAPSVVPLNQPIRAPVVDGAVPLAAGQSGLPDSIRVNSTIGMVRVKSGPLLLDISPLLTFESCSPDQCWTNFAPSGHGTLSRRILRSERDDEGRATFRYDGDAEHLLQVLSSPTHNGCTIESFSRLDQSVFSHLNFFCDIAISGHRRLSIAFSPCPDIRVDVEPADYPFGRPTRFAYLDTAKSFHVVEASSGEKGPFRTLASGPLPETASLTLMLFDDDKRVATMTFEDWASQSSTELSPTAGWGVPMNAIEFQRGGISPDSPVSISLTLASTSVGRGLDSVGHSAGIYRNRIRIDYD